ncbi:MAG: hypothetical protein BWY28_02381 [bacterium ADurb.Bin236]|nr:MAG: hypothetical protein BWY28_02381 [bacterium ADurb.Bin236]
MVIRSQPTASVPSGQSLWNVPDSVTTTPVSLTQGFASFTLSMPSASQSLLAMAKSHPAPAVPVGQMVAEALATHVLVVALRDVPVGHTHCFITGSMTCPPEQVAKQPLDETS